MPIPTFNYVRTHRLRHALSLEELAPIVGQCSGSAISYFEAGVRVPSLEAALSLQILFGPAPREMFPGFYEAVEENVMLRAAELYQSLQTKTDSRSQAKRDLLDTLHSRSFPNADIV